MKRGWIYILRCFDKSYYCGSTSNIEQRINEHIFHKYSGYTSTRLPIELVFSQEFENINDAIKAERQIKGWSRKKKDALINGDFDLLHELAKCSNETLSYNKK